MAPERRPLCLVRLARLADSHRPLLEVARGDPKESARCHVSIRAVAILWLRAVGLAEHSFVRTWTELSEELARANARGANSERLSSPEGEQKKPTARAVYEAHKRAPQRCHGHEAGERGPDDKNARQDEQNRQPQQHETEPHACAHKPKKRVLGHYRLVRHEGHDSRRGVLESAKLLHRGARPRPTRPGDGTHAGVLTLFRSRSP